MGLGHDPAAESLGFGHHFAVLNLDWMSILINAAKHSTEGQAFISNCIRWNDAVHAKQPRPLTVFTSLYFSNSFQPELSSDINAPFTMLVREFDPFIKGSDAVRIYPEITVDDEDIVLQKTRWYAGAGNALEQILRTQNIDTVIISGLTLSGAVMSTIYRLLDLDYKIFVISDNVLELPTSHHAEYSSIVLGSLLEKVNVKVISLETALQALN
ncbi:hypothetical protein ACHAQD_008511 [Fusarium lateritium]